MADGNGENGIARQNDVRAHPAAEKQGRSHGQKQSAGETI
jgi:hypothetical protein